ncbi:pre-B-cell leukemia homeobox interacting protein 1b isoform X2 [Salminus brasiliensis]|uniref:pre-B-cell leukemia homeobox interacting protein 1b isoform X2 n=1 Tax=Salminus brasiliensis TaxID=930266 RepID=UPI003B832E03
MADNSSGANGNSWTILAPEIKESGVESVGPLPEGPEGQLGTEQPDSKDLSQRSDFADGPSEQNNAPESPQVAPLETNEDEAILHASQVKDSALSATPVENLTWSSDPEQQGATAGHPESEPLLNPDADSFSDSYTHISPSPELTVHPAASQDEEGVSPGHEKSEPRKTLREESTPDVEVSEEQDNEGDGLRRRKVPQLSPVDHRDDDEEEEGEEEPFRPPRRDDDVGFSLNKCIFGAVILLGLGTIFFSEGDADVQELKNPELPKEWLNLEASKDMPAGVQPPETMERLEQESQKIAVLQAQLQEQQGELKAAQLQVEEGTKERLKREEIEVEIQKMRGELDKLPALQKELEQGNERAKKDLEALPAMQKELELLKSRVKELTQSTDGAQAVTPPSDSVSPSAGHESEMAAGQGKKELRDRKVRKEKEGKGGRKDQEEGKPWKDQGNEGKEPKKQKEQEKKIHPDEGKEWKVKGERKVWEDKKAEKEGKKGKKQEDGKRWKDTEIQREPKDEGRKRERKEDDKRRKDSKAKREFSEEGSGKEDKKWKKEKPWQLDGGRWETKERKHSQDKVDDGKEWNLRGDRKEGKDKKESKRSGDKVEGGKEWNLRGNPKEGKDEGEWKRGRQAGSNDKKEWKEKNEKKKDWKERNEQDSEKEQRSPKGERKAHRKDPQKGEKDHHEGNGGKKEWKERADKRSSGKEKERAKNGKKAEDRKRKDDYEKNGEKWSKKDKSRNPLSDEASHHSYSDRKQSQGHKHVDYWAEQRERIRHYRGSTEGCDSATACAHAEGLRPVGQSDFEALLFAYLTKLLVPENQASKKEELSKLVGEFFTNGVFVHDQIPFSEFVEDVADILEDMAELEEDEKVEDEMEEFAREAMEKFVLPDRGGNEGKRKESGRKRVSG